MKIENIIVTLALILTFSCQKEKKKSEINTIQKTELRNEKSKIELKSENMIFRDIAKLEKYNGFEKVSGQVLRNSDKALVYIQKDSLKILVLEKIIKNSSPKANYSILDEVTFTFKNSKQYIALTPCDLIENPNDKIIFSLVEYEDIEYFNKILKTWIIDLKENKFKEIETNKVKCINEEFGYDG